MDHTTYQTFHELLRGLDGYIDELSPYQVDRLQVLFPQLPLELREMIYDYVLSLTAFDVGTWDFVLRIGTAATGLIGLLCVNEATRIDAGLHFIRTLRHNINMGNTAENFSRFLETFSGEQGFLNVRRLGFPEFSKQVPRAGVAGNLDLMKRCLKLREIELRFKSPHLLRGWNVRRYNDDNWQITDEDGSELMSLEEVVRLYRLEDIFELESLDVIILYLTPILRDRSHEDEWQMDDAIELVRKVATWLHVGFKQLNRDVRIGGEVFHRRIIFHPRHLF